jgi:WD40 repeat protein
MNPFPGLRPFREQEEYLFFGRENQVDTVVDKLARRRFLAVVGSSGSGKSSLVNCGLRPALHRGLMASAGSSWSIVQLRPGSQPIRALARALADESGLFPHHHADDLPLVDLVEAALLLSKRGLLDIYEQAAIGSGTHLLVVVDQFEELFRYRKLATARSSSEHARSEAAIAFVNLLLTAADESSSPVHIVLTMRSDFLGDCAQFPGLAEAINEGQYLVPRLTREERRAAIAGPVAVGGGTISPVLLTRLVNDVGDNPDQLSILQHALNRTWARWERDGAQGSLELSHYEAIGTMADALDQHAEEAYAELKTPVQRRACERIFKALTDRGTDARGVRRPASFATLCALSGAEPSDVSSVIDVFREPSRSFLMPPLPETLEPDTTIDISHESLMRVWRRLETWTAEEAQSAQRYRRLEETAAEHASGKASLLRDPELQLSLDWQRTAEPSSAWAMLYGGDFDASMRFLAESQAVRAREQLEKEQAQRRELEQAEALAAERARSARRLRNGLVFAAILAALAAATAVWAIQQRARARDSQTLAVARQLAAESGLLQADAQGDPETAALLAIASIQRVATLEGDRSLRTVIAHLPRRTPSLAHSGPVTAMAFQPDGKRLATGAGDGTLRVFEPARGAVVWQQNQGAAISAVAYSADGRRLATASGDVVHVLDAASGTEVWRQQHGGTVGAVAFSADGRWLATACEDAAMRVFDAASGSEAWRVAHRQRVGKVSFSADGQWLVSVSGDRVRVFDTKTRQDAWSDNQQRGVEGLMFASGGTVTAMALNDSGERIAFGTAGEFAQGSWQVVDTATANRVGMAKHKGSVATIALSPDGKSLVLSDGGIAELIDVASGREVARVVHQGTITAISYSPDGRLAVTGSQDGAVRVFDAATGTETARFVHKSPVRAVTFSSDGESVASGAEDGSASAFAADAREPTRIFAGRSLMLSGDGQRVVQQLADFMDAEIVDVVDLRLETTLMRLKLGPQFVAGVTPVALSGDGRRLLIGGGFNEVKLFDTATQKELWSTHEQVDAVAISADGALVAAGGKKGASVFDAATGKKTVHLRGDAEITALAFSADHRRLAAATNDQTRIFDATTGREERSAAWSGKLVELSADGRRLMTVAGDNALLFDADSGNELARFPLSQPHPALKLSDDGRRLVMTTANRARVLDTSTGNEEVRIATSGNIGGALFLNRGRALLTASREGPHGEVLELTRHVLGSQDLIDDACSRLTRNLTTQEWRQYVGTAAYRKGCPGLP